MRRYSVCFAIFICLSLFSNADDFTMLFVQNGDPLVLDDSREPFEDRILGSIFVDKNLDIYIADMAAGNVKRYDKNGKLLTVYRNPGRKPGQFETPSSAIVKGGLVIVNDINSDYYPFFNKDTGKYIKCIKKAAVVTSLKADPAGRIYYAFSPKPDADSVCRVDGEFRPEKCFFRQSQLTGFTTEMHRLRVMDFDDSNNVYVGIRLSYKIAVFDKNLKLRRIFGELGEQWNQLAEYEGGMVDPGDWAKISARHTFLNNLYVLENRFLLQVKTAVNNKKAYYLDLYALDGRKIFGEVYAEKLFAGRDHLGNIYIDSIKKTAKGGAVHVITRYRLKTDIM